MDTRFIMDNRHREDAINFKEFDPDLCELNKLKYVYVPSLLQKLPIHIPGVYTLTGGCLTGKTTTLKLWIAKLLTDGISPQSITFFSAEFIKDDKELIQLLQTQLENKSMEYIIIDDVTYVHEWDKAIKFAMDTGLLKDAILVLSSSDVSINKKLQLNFPYRINTTEMMDLHLYPLSFHETVLLKHTDTQITDIDLYAEFNEYLTHGGYLCAINDIALHGKILDETLIAYTDSLRKVVKREGKQDHFLNEILTAIIEHYNKPITWNGLTQELSIEHTKTIGNYIAMLESHDAVFMQSALIETTLKAAPKKARKLMFTDPFIFHAIRTWLHQPNKNSFETLIKPSLDDAVLNTNLVKACVTTHYRRYYPTYYIKDEGEIDLVYLYDRRSWPVVIMWTNPLRTKDLKQILKYPNAKILTKTARSGIIEHIRTEPLPQALWRLDE